LLSGAILDAIQRGKEHQMIRKHLRLKRLVLGTAVSLAIAALSAPAVLAKPTSGYGPLDPWAYSLVHRPATGNGPLDPWAYGLVHRSTQATPASYSAVSGPVGVAAYQSFAGITPKQGEGVTSQSGFNWGDAGIGASVAFGALLLLLTVVALGRRYRPRINRSGLATS
jgi:hypothetical protein